MILNFKEIPEANKGGGLQDTFELFSRDFLSYLGYVVIEDPDRGADGKRDMIVEEHIHGISDEFNFRWLVSCKHWAHSGKAVNDAEEINILERLKQHKCQGFMAVYSTLCATSLSGMLNGLKNDGYKCIVYDHEKIEKELLKGDIEGLRICERYMPVSFETYHSEHPGISNVFSTNEPIKCDLCGKDLLLGDGDTSIYVLLGKKGKVCHTTEDMYFACKGICDDKLLRQYESKGFHDEGWEDIRDLTIPTVWLSRLMAFINSIQDEHNMGDKAFLKMKQMFLRTYPYVARNLTTKEQERVKSLIQIIF